MTDLETARYVSLATFRRSGAEVATPVWTALRDGIYWIFSAGDAGKVKRLRNSDRVRLAPCDVRGGLLGEWCDGRAALVSDPARIRDALAALRAKYGWQMWLADAGARVTGRFEKRAYIAVRLTDSSNEEEL